MQAGRAYPAGARQAGFCAGTSRFHFVVVHSALHLPYFIGLDGSWEPQKRFKFEK